MCALNRDEPDRVPYIEATVDIVVYRKLTGKEGSGPTAGGILKGTGQTRTIEIEKEISRLLNRDNVNFRLNAPVYAEFPKGKDGREFFGQGQVRTWVYHSDGNLLPIMEDWLSVGQNGIHPVEPLAMDIRFIKKAYGHRVCVCGNVDLNLLGMGTQQEVEEEVKGLIRDLAPGGGYMVSSGNSVPAYAKPENALSLGRAVRKYGKYPINLS